MKTINLVDVKIRDITLTENAQGYTLSIAYTLVDENGNNIITKNHVETNFTVNQKDVLESIFTMVKTKLKTLEGI